MSTKIILGPPGTGKTEYLLRKVEKKLEEAYIVIALLQAQIAEKK